MMLEAAIAEVLADCNNEEERQILLDRTSRVRSDLAKLIDTVEAKATAHQMLATHLESCTAIEQEICRLLKQLQDDKLSAEQISELQTDLSKAHSQLSQLESHTTEVQAVMTRANLVIKDQTMHVTLNLDAKMQKMLDNVDKCNFQLCAEADRLSEIAEIQQVYSVTKTSVQNDLQELQRSILAAEVESSQAGIKEFLDCLLNTQKKWSESAESYERLKSVKQQLAMIDVQSVDKTNDECEQIDIARTALESVLLHSIDRAAVVLDNWQSFAETKNRVMTILADVKSVLSKTTQLGSLQALRERLAFAKVFCCLNGFC